MGRRQHYRQLDLTPSPLAGEGWGGGRLNDSAVAYSKNFAGG